MKNKFLIDENGNIMKCGVKGCNKNAVTYFIPMLKDSPLCEEHDYFFNNNECIYVTDKNGYNGEIRELL